MLVNLDFVTRRHSCGSLGHRHPRTRLTLLLPAADNEGFFVFGLGRGEEAAGFVARLRICGEDEAIGRAVFVHLVDGD